MSTADWPYPVNEFKCHLCGNCCRGEGYVEMLEDDIERAAAFLGVSDEGFRERYCDYDRTEKMWHLIDQGDAEKSCIFLNKDNTCKIHEAKPYQCAGFPKRWRPENIMDFCAGWRAAAGLPPADEKRTMSED